MLKRPLVEIRNTRIFERYAELYFGQLMREEEIYKILVTEFYLEKRTLYGIVLEMSKQETTQEIA